LNEILEKGFDGQHFLVGFGEHIRNLLVCKDPSTVKLLETAPNIRQRYLEQATVCSPDLLLKILDINNKCDLNYRISNNKRLHLELALMQMCMLGQRKETDPPSLIPDAGLTSPPLPPSPPLPSSPSSPPIEPKPSTSKKYDNHLTGTISIKAPVKPDVKITDSDTGEDANRTATPFTNEELKTHWKAFATGLKTDFPHLATTLTSRDPLLKDEWAIDFEVDNRILEEELNQKRGELLEYLRQMLDNFQITLQTRIQENLVERKPYTDKEKFEQMAAKNPALNKLKEQLDLDIEY